MAKKTLILIFTVIAMMSFTGCTGQKANSSSNTPADSNPTESTVNSGSDANSSSEAPNIESDGTVSAELPDLQVQFGRETKPYIVHLYDNDTAATLARYVGESVWDLPIYDYNKSEYSDVMQYYDIPGSYTIPSDPETITSQRAGEVYYSAPNRVIVFYQNAEVTGEYTKIGYIDYTDELADELAEVIENSPVLENYDCKVFPVGLAR